PLAWLMHRDRLARSPNCGSSSLTGSLDCQRSIVSFDRSFDNLGFLNAKFRQMGLSVIRSQEHSLISTALVPKDADRCALALTSVEPIVAHKALGLLNDPHELLGYATVGLSTILRIYNEAGNVIETHERAGDFKEW
ncbi:MAG: hypothetical protein WAN04_09720, partial [Candidatus Udaeobacter sp.]